MIFLDKRAFYQKHSLKQPSNIDCHVFINIRFHKKPTDIMFSIGELTKKLKPQLKKEGITLCKRKICYARSTSRN